MLVPGRVRIFYRKCAIVGTDGRRHIVCLPVIETRRFVVLELRGAGTGGQQHEAAQDQVSRVMKLHEDWPQPRRTDIRVSDFR